jgi:hypothetical protein
MHSADNFLVSHGRGPVKPGHEPDLLEAWCRLAPLAAHDQSDVLGRANGEPI